MGKQCTVIDSFNSTIKVGTVFDSQRAAARALPKGAGIKIGLQMEDGSKLQFRRTENMIFMEPYGKIPGISTDRLGDVRRPGRTGRTSWEVTDAGTSGIKIGRVFTSKSALVTAVNTGSTFHAKDLATGTSYRFVVNAATYRMSAVK